MFNVHCHAHIPKDRLERRAAGQLSHSSAREGKGGEGEKEERQVERAEDEYYAEVCVLYL